MASVVDRFVFAGYGELSSVCRDRNSTANPNANTRCLGPDEALVYSRGNAYLESQFPKLTYIRNAVVEEGGDPVFSGAGTSGALVAVAVVLAVAFAAGTLLVAGMWWRRRQSSGARVVLPLGDASGFVKL